MIRAIKVLIWSYVFLLLTEGALRKWLFPAWSAPLLIVRDPIVIAIYALAIAKRVFPINNFSISIGLLAMASLMVSLLGEMTNLLVIAYGVRINYFHLPLIWILGAVMNRRDVERIGIFILLSSIPMTLLMVEQFRSPMDAWINKGVGTDEVGQIFGAEDHVRPPGLFSFITGPQIYYPFCAALFFHQLTGQGRLRWPLLVVCGVAIVVALPVSISRTVMLATGIVAVVFVLCMPFLRERSLGQLRLVLLLCILAFVVTRLPILHEAGDVFQIRWEMAATESGGHGWSDVLDRTVRTFTNPFYHAISAPLIGQGIGVGSNVGAKLLTGSMGFLLAEEEYAKIYLELGVVVGTGFIFLRLAIAAHLVVQSLRALREHHDALPLLLFSATCVPLIYGQWAPPVILGFAVVGSGLILAAANETPMHISGIDRDRRKTVTETPMARTPRSSPHRLPFSSKSSSKCAPEHRREDRYRR